MEKKEILVRLCPQMPAARMWDTCEKHGYIWKFSGTWGQRHPTFTSIYDGFVYYCSKGVDNWDERVHRLEE